MVSASLVSNKNESEIPPFVYEVSRVCNLYADVPKPLRLRIFRRICLGRRNIARKIKSFLNLNYRLQSVIFSNFTRHIFFIHLTPSG